MVAISRNDLAKGAFHIPHAAKSRLMALANDLKLKLQRTPHSNKNGIACGIIGNGAIFRNAYAPALNRTNCPIVCRSIFNPRIESARSASKRLRYTPDAYSSLTQFFNSGITCVIILSPNDSHYEYTRLAIEQGLHVICEKPLSRRATEIKELSALTSQSATRVMVGYCLRYDQRLRETGSALKRILEGSVMNITVRHEVDIRAEIRRSSWLGDSTRTGGGALHHCGIHMVNLLCDWFGEPEVVSACVNNLHRPLSAGEDYAVCNLRFQNKIAVKLETAYVSSRAARYAEISASAGSVNLLSTASPSMLRIASPEGEDLTTKFPTNTPESLASAQIQDFADHIAKGTDPATGIEDSLRTQRCIEDCYSRSQTPASHQITLNEQARESK